MQMHLYRIVEQICVSLLVLQFDGSLRRGGDPNEDIIPKSVSSKYLSPFASSSSALLFNSHGLHGNRSGNSGVTERVDHPKVISLSGRAIPYHRELSSADVEYEGLIMGLNDLLRYCSARSERTGNRPFRTIKVQGDCKMIIDQMNQRSTPRKQQMHYNEAKNIVNKLEEEYRLKLKFEHVLRDKNILCDHMCKVIIQKLQSCAINGIIHEIKETEEKYVPVKLPSSKKRRFNFKETAFAVPLNRISEWESNTRIPLSLRPYLLCDIYFASSAVDDYVGMRLIGDAMKVEAQRWKRLGIVLKNGDNEALQQLNLIGSRLVCSSLESMDLTKEAKKYSKSITREMKIDKVHHVQDEEVRQLQGQLPWLRSGPDEEDFDTLEIAENEGNHHELQSALNGWQEKVAQMLCCDECYEVISHQHHQPSQ